jgi:hypothetical protein
MGRGEVGGIEHLDYSSPRRRTRPKESEDIFDLILAAHVKQTWTVRAVNGHTIVGFTLVL